MQSIHQDRELSTWSVVLQDAAGYTSGRRARHHSDQGVFRFISAWISVPHAMADPGHRRCC